MSTSPTQRGRPLSRRDLLDHHCTERLRRRPHRPWPRPLCAASHSAAGVALRPPGAQPEDDFNGICLRCGLCVRACPFEMLHLARLGQLITTGTPYFIAREAGCEMCPEIPALRPAQAMR